MYLFFFLLLYFLLVFLIRSLMVWQRTGVNPMTFNKGDDAHGFNGKVFTLVSVLELVVVFIYAFVGKWYQYLLPFWYLEHGVLMTIGWVLLWFSLLFVWVAQTQMSNSWRIGIDEKNKTALVTSGLFAFSRNPIFLGIMIANLGLFLVMPNAFSLLIVSLSSLSINTQIRLEENFLTQAFGAEYQEYAKKVNRWF